MSDTAGWLSSLDGVEKRRQVVRARFNKGLRKPDRILQVDDDGLSYSVAYWRVPEGIIKAPVRKGKFIPEEMTLIEEKELILFLALIDDSMGIPLDKK